MDDSLRLLVDVGNTRSHFAVARGSRILARHDVPHGNGRTAWSVCLERVCRAAASLDAASPGAESELVVYRAAVSSVNPVRSEDLVEFLERTAGLRVTLVERYDQVPINVALGRPETVGVDRLLNALAARRIAAGAHIILDFGSALTVDLVDASGVFRGGAIAPGLITLSRCLADSTALLPRVTITREPPVLGDSTIGAIRSGLFHGLVGAARHLLSELFEEAGEARVWATGGDASLLAPHVVGIGRIVPDLTLKGLALATLQDARDGNA